MNLFEYIVTGGKYLLLVSINISNGVPKMSRHYIKAHECEECMTQFFFPHLKQSLRV